MENQIEIGYQSFLFVIQQKHGALPEGVTAVTRWQPYCSKGTARMRLIMDRVAQRGETAAKVISQVP